MQQIKPRFDFLCIFFLILFTFLSILFSTLEMINASWLNCNSSMDMDGGGVLGFQWVPTAKRPRRAETVNAKIKSGFGGKGGAVTFKLRPK